MQQQPNQLKDKKPKNGNSNGNGNHNSQESHLMSVGEDLLPERPFKDLHNPIIKAIWKNTE